ncbi:MAG: beta-ketoacyl-[acyl-carrier-protein] synthase family protein [Prevotellaceae bacterium]|jgi:3-oxoacyl-[acyl-carrier-protein] synthase-1|nr:beta-ketoacyl-[acyl-carrier-protein] synthase family protein [Prevotellaceae bacterium]
MKIYVTGVGAISGIGLNVGEHLTSLASNKHGMGPVTLFPTTLNAVVSEVKCSNDKLKEILKLPFDKTYSRTTLLGMVAAKEALESSGIKNVNAFRTGFISSTSVGGMDLSEQAYVNFRNNPQQSDVQKFSQHDCGDSTQRIADYLGITEFTTTISTACSSAANAVIMGARMIKNGLLDAVVVGGTDALCKFTLNGFNSLMILDNEHCRPFDRSRSGLNLGEGAGYIVLQNEYSLYSNPYCLLTGYANANDAYHQTATSPEGEGTYECMRQSIELAGINPSDVGYINVHGTGTPNNDLSEGKAIERLFKDKVPPFSSVKAFIGHTLGAAEGIEAVLSVLSVTNGIVYPNLNFKNLIDNSNLIPITEYKQGLPLKHVLSNSFGFGGNDSSLLFSFI